MNRNLLCKLIAALSLLVAVVYAHYRYVEYVIVLTALAGILWQEGK